MPEFPKLAIETTGLGAVTLGYIGSVADVLAAKLPDTLSNRIFCAEEYAYGFELASPRDKYSLGEAVIVNGICYATSSDKTSPDYNNTIFGREFVTGGMFIIPHDVEPSHKVTFKANGSSLPISDFYSGLYDAVKQPAAFVSIMEFASFHGTAIGKPPIDGKAIFDHKKEYFPNPETITQNVTAFVIGVLTDYEEPGLSEIKRQLEVVLYKNPFDSGSALSNHAHVLTLKQPVNEIEEIRPDLAEKTLHLFTDGTALRSLHANVFTIGRLIDYQNDPVVG